MRKTRSSANPKQQPSGSPPRSTGSVTRSQRKRAPSAVDHEAVPRKKSKTNLVDEDDSSKKVTKGKKPAAKKAKKTR
jgi:hypothetical protein